MSHCQKMSRRMNYVGRTTNKRKNNHRKWLVRNVYFPPVVGLFSFASASRPILNPTQLPILRVRVIISAEI